MNDIFWFLHSLVFYSLISRILSDYQPFIFHLETLEFYLDWKNVPADKGPYAVACPSSIPSSMDYDDFSQKNIQEQNYLFVQKYVVEKDDSITCDKFFDLAFVLHRTLRGIFIEFGYEGFIWFADIAIRYNFEAWNVISVSYSITQNAIDSHLKCPNVNLGKEFYNGDELKNYYAQENQNKVFGDECSSIHYRCEVIHHNLLWPYQFQTSSSSPFSCSDLTSVPVWDEYTEMLLNYSEEILVALAVEIKSKLKITLGTYKTMKLQISKNLHPQKIYLDSENNRIPVPRIIYKIVKYQIHDCNPMAEPCWFAMVIIHHNEPYVNPNDKICEDKCEKWGWGIIQFRRENDIKSTAKPDHIYCCELDPDLKEKLIYVNNDSKIEQLRLKSFPVFDADTGKVNFYDKRKAIEDKMDNLFQGF